MILLFECLSILKCRIVHSGIVFICTQNPKKYFEYTSKSTSEALFRKIVCKCSLECTRNIFRDFEYKSIWKFYVFFYSRHLAGRTHLGTIRMNVHPRNNVRSHGPVHFIVNSFLIISNSPDRQALQKAENGVGRKCVHLPLHIFWMIWLKCTTRRSILGPSPSDRIIISFHSQLVNK